MKLNLKSMDETKHKIKVLNSTQDQRIKQNPRSKDET